MKKQHYFQKTFRCRAAIFIFLCVLFAYTGGQVNNIPNNKKDRPYYKHGAFSPAPYSEIQKYSTIILWKPNIPDADFTRWVKHHNIPEGNKMHPYPFCGAHGPELYEGVTIELFCRNT
jgi:hypothetical protein